MRELRLWLTAAVVVLSGCLDVSSGGCVWFDQCGNSPNSTLKTLNCKYDGDPGKGIMQSNELQRKQISCLAWQYCGTSFGGRYFENNTRIMVFKGTRHQSSTQNLRVFRCFWVLVALTSTLVTYFSVLINPKIKFFEYSIPLIYKFFSTWYW